MLKILGHKVFSSPWIQISVSPKDDLFCKLKTHLIGHARFLLSKFVFPNREDKKDGRGVQILFSRWSLPLCL